MPLELKFYPENGKSCGTVEEINNVLEKILPNALIYKDKSGREKVALMEEKGIKVFDFMREEAYLSTKGLHHIDYEGDEFSLELYFDGTASVDGIYVDYRGRGNPMPLFTEIAKQTGWRLFALSNKQEIITDTIVREFQQWRDSAIEYIKSEES